MEIAKIWHRYSGNIVMKPANNLSNTAKTSQQQKKIAKNKETKIEDGINASEARVSPHSLFNLFTANIIKKNILR